MIQTRTGKEREIEREREKRNSRDKEVEATNSFVNPGKMDICRREKEVA